ncbi:MAG: hypothetical protein WCP28_12580 [Actinomycetes bacterium]
MNIQSRIAAVLVAAAAVAALIVPNIALAAPGAGIDKGTMPAPSPANPGATYDLQPITLFNTGDAAATYEMLVVPVSKSRTLAPSTSWFVFNPQKFDLAPGAHQLVRVTMKLPSNAAAGNYEALLGGRPMRQASGVFINVGAAARLKMQVAQSTFMAGLYYSSMSLIQATAPWSYVTMAAIVVAIALLVFFVLRSRRADEDEDLDDEEDDDTNSRAA